MESTFEPHKPDAKLVGLPFQERLNPYAVTAYVPGKDLPPKRIPDADVGRWRRTLAQFLAGSMLVGTLPAAAAACIKIETIVLSGAIFGVAAIALMWLAFAPPLRRLQAIAAPFLIFVLTVFLLINVNSWSPAQAKFPVSSLCVVFAMAVQFGWYAIVETSRKRSHLISDHESAGGFDPSVFLPVK